MARNLRLCKKAETKSMQLARGDILSYTCWRNHDTTKNQ